MFRKAKRGSLLRKRVTLLRGFPHTRGCKRNKDRVPFQRVTLMPKSPKKRKRHERLSIRKPFVPFVVHGIESDQYLKPYAEERL